MHHIQGNTLTVSGSHLACRMNVPVNEVERYYMILQNIEQHSGYCPYKQNQD